MKIYIRSNQSNNISLTDLFDYIDTIVIVPDARNFNMNAVAASVDDDSIFNRFSSMTDDDIHKISDAETLDVIYHTSPDRLSEEQITILREYYYQKYTISKDDVAKIISALRECNEVNILGIKKNRSFMNKFSDMKQRALGIIHSLKITDYLENTKTADVNGFGDDFIVFIKKVKTDEPETGEEMEIKIYIKIDVTQTLEDGGTIAVVSFHNAKTDEPVYPYVKYELSIK